MGKILKRIIANELLEGDGNHTAVLSPVSRSAIDAIKVVMDTATATKEDEIRPCGTKEYRAAITLNVSGCPLSMIDTLHIQE